MNFKNSALGRIIGDGFDLNTYTVIITNLHPTEEKKLQTNASLVIVNEFLKEPRVKNQIDQKYPRLIKYLLYEIFPLDKQCLIKS